MKMLKRRWIQQALPPVALSVVLLAVWQAAVMLFQIPGWLLPSPLAIVGEASASFDKISMHALATLRLTVLGFVIGSAFGLVLSFGLHRFEKVRAALYPLLVLSQNVPTIVLAPLLMLWFGFGLFPKIVVITLVCFFPIAVATLDGFARTDRTMLSYMQMIGASRRQIFLKLELPHALPSMFSGLKISATYSVMGAIIGEWLGSDRGIGVYMLLQKTAFRIDRVFISIVFIMGLSLLLFGLIMLLEKWLIRWKPGK